MSRTFKLTVVHLNSSTPDDVCEGESVTPYACAALVKQARKLGNSVIWNKHEGVSSIVASFDSFSVLIQATRG